MFQVRRDHADAVKAWPDLKHLMNNLYQVCPTQSGPNAVWQRAERIEA